MNNVLELYRMLTRGDLPEDVTVINVPIVKTAYDDYVILGYDKRRPPEDTKWIADTGQEQVTLEPHDIDGKTVFLAFAGKAKILIVGEIKYE